MFKSKHTKRILAHPLLSRYADETDYGLLEKLMRRQCDSCGEWKLPHYTWRFPDIYIYRRLCLDCFLKGEEILIYLAVDNFVKYLTFWNDSLYLRFEMRSKLLFPPRNRKVFK